MRGGCWPTPEQELLLQAALDEGPAVTRAWQAWRARVVVEQLDPGSVRLLPLLYANLVACGIDDPLLPLLKGKYRQTWSLNQLRLHQLAAQLRLLHDAGLHPTMLLKGGALALRYYGSPGLRPMDDLDLLVPTALGAEAMAALRRQGWRPSVSSPERLLPHRASTPFEHPAGWHLDLHWHVLQQRRHAGADDAFWAAAEPVEIEGVRTSVLHPTHQLLHVLAHGITWHVDTARPYWVADAAVILRTAGARVDWAELLAQARASDASLYVRHGLAYLDGRFGLTIPPEVLREASLHPGAWPERIAYRCRTTRLAHSPFGKALLLWQQHAGAGVFRRLRTFPAFLRDVWDLPRVRDLPGYVSGAYLRRARRAAAGRPQPRRE